MPRKKRTAQDAASAVGAPTGQPPQVPSGRGYGERAKLEQAQQAVPVGAAPPPLNLAEVMASAKATAAPPSGGFARPSERPDEPITAGLSGGPGPGPGSIGLASPDDPTVILLEEIARVFPAPEIFELIQEIHMKGPQ